MHVFAHNGRLEGIIDTPGFNRSTSSRSDEAQPYSTHSQEIENA